ncbi:hypothetical protein GCM10010532_102060 [Dactylosporangium siamense]|uniref:ARB-07466-like C-terminal domain-containing protein n=2 Tax=Dactylosporangium siamense TaxID=685454 RepID=A0A919PNU9_9ACTN|nr:hypothetical protein [Dactylosporangium siamense]GIG45800.1 hypothetical protein Dsi01nite_038410 [Dactylosporangium siamense]
MRTRHVLAGLAVFAVVASIGVYVLVQRISDHLPQLLPPGHACVINTGNASVTAGTSSGTDTSVPLDAEQVANAATITAVGLRRGVSQRGLVVALATAWQESKLENLSGGDRDSIGLFQQRPSQGWGKPEQIADPRFAANAFYTALLKVKGWEKMRVTDAAQEVQRSAHPEAYEKWVDESEIMARALSGDATSAVACTVTESTSHGVEAAKTLTAGVKLDWGNNVSTADVADLVGVALKVREQKTGWQYAHWLVAHAQDHGVKRVAFNDMEWTAKSGGWTRVTQRGGTAAGQVVAEVY